MRLLPGRQAQSSTAECRHRRRLWRAAALAFPLSAFGTATDLGLFGRRRLGLVIGDDAPDRRQNLLHGGLLDLCRLRHFRLQIINALAALSYTKAGRALVFPQARVGIFIATVCLVPRSSGTRPNPRPSASPARGFQASQAEELPNATRIVPVPPGKAMSWQQTIASKAPRRFGGARSALRSSSSVQASFALSARRACERRTSCREPAGSARSDRRWWSAD